MNILDKLEEFKDFKDAELSTTIDDSKGEEDHLKVNEESMDLDGEWSSKILSRYGCNKIRQKIVVDFDENFQSHLSLIAVFIEFIIFTYYPKSTTNL